MGIGDCGDDYSHATQPVPHGSRLAVALAFALTLGLAGCVPAKIGPTVQVMPGVGKSFEAFQADQAACEQYASDQVKDDRKEANQQGTQTIQQRYDIAYSQCMYSKGNQVPGYEPAPVAAVAPPPPPPKPKYDAALVRGIQAELARIGLYSGAPDGMFGGRTRGAIKDFEKMKGLPADGIPTKALLGALKKS
jgi:hypothetical protein